MNYYQNINKIIIRCATALAILLVANACTNEPSTGGEPTGAYNEQHRPQFHFTPPQQWMNDPNGMVYYEGEYHLFYQHYPDSNVWGPMHWGHAVSADLVTWEQLPIAIYPDTLGLIFSGSAVVDWNNTSGFGQDSVPPLVAIYTYHNMDGERDGSNDFQTQAIAYSNDKGRTWTKYEGNPVIPNTENIRDFRDPKVFWHEVSQQWVMALAVLDRVRIYNSKNLKEWTLGSEFGMGIGSDGRPWECPDLFQLPIEGSDAQKWVMLVSLGAGGYNGGSATQYFVGDFDGSTFTLDPALAPQYQMTKPVVPNGDVFADFENGYGDWTVEGNAFGDAPAKGTLSGQRDVEGYTGAYLVNSFLNGDASTGKLSSPQFTINKNHINFQIGGGLHPKETCINLVVDGKVARTATGDNNENLKWASWDVSDLKGKSATIEIIDSHEAGWGHINVDQIVFADAAAEPIRSQTLWIDYGRDNYAGVTWSDIPAEDGRRLFIGWMSNWQYATIVPTFAWRSAMTLPRVLSLKETPQGLRLVTKPVKETEQLRAGDAHSSFENVPFAANQMEAKATFEMAENCQSKFGLVLTNAKGETYRVGFDAAKNEFFSDRTNAGKKDFSDVFAENIHTAPRLTTGNTIDFHVFFDVASAEVFADGGLTVFTDIYFPNEDFNKVEVFMENADEVKTTNTALYPIKRIWK